MPKTKRRSRSREGREALRQCIGIGGLRIDGAVDRELEEAQYEASPAARRYDLVDPAKRHVARELEARWNTALERVAQIEQRLVGLGAEMASRPRIDRAALMELAHDGHSMAVKQKKRRWPDDEKRSICFQTTAAGVSVAQVARRYAMNANLIFKWLKDDRYAPAVDVVPEADGPVFLPVEIEASASVDLAVTGVSETLCMALSPCS